MSDSQVSGCQLPAWGEVKAQARLLPFKPDWTTGF